MSQTSEYQRSESEKGSVTYVKNREEGNIRKITITVPLLHIKVKSKKYPGRQVTRGFYLNIPSKNVEGMDIKDGELVELTIKKISK